MEFDNGWTNRTQEKQNPGSKSWHNGTSNCNMLFYGVIDILRWNFSIIYMFPLCYHKNGNYL